MKSTANIAQSEQTPDPAQPKWVEIPFIQYVIGHDL